ncbi:MAG: type II toxin-antitoxin system RelE/ParE family toxin, partial [Patescibacteria group bacterium]
FLPEAEKDLAKLGREVRRRIIVKLDWLLKNFENILPEVLTGEFKEFYKLRIGDWRVIYKINWANNTIIVCYIDKRDKIYKKR